MSDDATQRPPTLYPPIAPNDSGWLEVEGGHRLYWESSGNPNGKPAVFLHGGPGGACHPDHRRLFHPDAYRIILFDQRGCGRSLPHASLDNNTTQHLVADLEALRLHLGVDRWVILGGSWGATLALAYAQQFAEHIEALILRGVFTGRQAELDWLYRFGASSMFPDAWQRFIAPIPADERGDLVGAYHRRLTGADIGARFDCARTWCAWESELMTVYPRPMRGGTASADEVALARIETHYFVNNTFLREGEILAGAPALAHIPTVIVQGRHDVVTPPVTAWALHQAMPGSQIHIVPGAGHATSEPGILARLLQATDRFSGR